MPEDNGAIPLHIKLNERAVSSVNVHFQTVDNSALAGADYTTTSGTVVLAPGTTDYVISVPTMVDNVPEPNETFSLVLSNPSNAVTETATAIGTILDDDDVAPPTATVISPNGGESVVPGASVNLQWTASDNVVVNAVDLSLSRDDGLTYEPIASGLANTGSYEWIATAPLTQLARFKVVARDHRLQEGQDASDAAWSIRTVDGVEPALPTEFALALASENPARGGIRIRYDLPRQQEVRLAILDVRGRVVAVLRNGVEASGVHQAVWEAAGTPAGVYFLRIKAGDWKAQRKIVRLR